MELRRRAERGRSGRAQGAVRLLLTDISAAPCAKVVRTIAVVGLFDRLDDLDRRAGLHLEPVPKHRYQRLVVISGYLELAVALALFVAKQWLFGAIVLAAGVLSLIERGRLFYFDGWPFMWPRRENRRDRGTGP